ncbi:P-loop domain-containing protein [Geobacter anodireducens]
MNDFNWTLEALAETSESLRDGNYLDNELLYPHEEIWPATQELFQEAAENILAQLNEPERKIFFSVCLASYLLDPSKAPSGFLPWFEEHSSIEEVLGSFPLSLNDLCTLRWGRVAIPLAVPREDARGRITYALAAVGRAHSMLPLFPSWGAEVLDVAARKGIEMASRLLSRKLFDCDCFLWPMVNRSNGLQIAGASLGLPAYLAFVSLANGIKIPKGIIATGALDENGNLLAVDGLEQKLSCSEENGYDTLIYPSGGKVLDRSGTTEPKAADYLTHAEEMWRSLDVHDRMHILVKTLKPLKFTHELERLTAHFIGRKWVINKVNRWVEAADGAQVLAITGGPGAGKSAIAAWLCKNRDYVAAHHFCDTNYPDTRDAANVLRSVAYQLALRLSVYHERISRTDPEEWKNQDSATLFRNLLVRPFEEGFPPDTATHVILIDALDEATASVEFAYLLAQGAKHLPSWLRILVTFRKEPRISSKFRAYPVIEVEPEAVFRPEDRTEICQYLEQEFPEVTHRQQDLFIDKSQGVFLYIRCVCDDVKQGHLSFDHLEDFPIGLHDVYMKFFKRVDFTEVKPLLRLVVAAMEPLPLELLQQMLGIGLKDELDQLLNKVGSLLIRQERLVEGKQVVVVQPFHLSLIDWLTDRKRAGDDCHIYRDDGDKVLSDAGWALYKDKALPLHRYFLAWLPSHLAASGRENAVVEFLKDFKTIMARAEAGLLERMIADYREISHPSLTDFWAFFRSNAPLLRRGHEAWPVYKILLQLAVEHGDESAVTKATEKWLDEGHCDWLWMRSSSRPVLPYQPVCLQTYQIMDGPIGGVEEYAPGTLLAWTTNGKIRIFGVEEPIYDEVDLDTFVDLSAVSYSWDALFGMTTFTLPSGAKPLRGIEQVRVDEGTIVVTTEAVDFRAYDSLIDRKRLSIKIWYRDGNFMVSSVETLEEELTLPKIDSLSVEMSSFVPWERKPTDRELKCDRLTMHPESFGEVIGLLAISDGTVVSFTNEGFIQRWPSNIFDIAPPTYFNIGKADCVVNSDVIARVTQRELDAFLEEIHDDFII